MVNLNNYRGNKAVSGLFQFIINRVPECTTIIEAFAGSGAITHKLLMPLITVKNNFTVRTVLNDCDRSVCNALHCKFPGTTVITNYTAAQLLLNLLPGTTDMFIYCDPPYKLSTRGSERRIYKHEMTDEDHIEFLTLATTGKFNCMISHYECSLYDQMLKGWNKEKFKVCYHGKVKEECIYYNYSKPEKLLSYQYVGADCWDRQRVTRKINRLVKKLTELPALERNAVLSRVNKRLT